MRKTPLFYRLSASRVVGLSLSAYFRGHVGTYDQHKECS